MFFLKVQPRCIKVVYGVDHGICAADDLLNRVYFELGDLEERGFFARIIRGAVYEAAAVVGGQFGGNGPTQRTGGTGEYYFHEVYLQSVHTLVQ